MFKNLTLIAVIAVTIATLSCGASDSETIAPASQAPPLPTSPAEVKTGPGLGERVPEFQISLTDGTPVTSSGLIAEERPAFLYFFSTT